MEREGVKKVPVESSWMELKSHKSSVRGWKMCQSGAPGWSEHVTNLTRGVEESTGLDLMDEVKK